MNTIKSLIFPQDISKLNKSLLKEICTDLNIDSSGTSNDLTNRIWTNFDQVEADVLIKMSRHIFAGAVSLAWYVSQNENGLALLKDKLIEKMPFNPFESVDIPPNDHIPNEPQVIAATNLDIENTYLLRFIHKTGVNVDYYLDNRREYIKHEITTVYINEKLGIIEIRASSTTSKKIISGLALILDEEYNFKQYDFITSHGNIEALADLYNGQLIDATAKPEGLVETFDETQGQAIVSILSAVDEYYNTNELSGLENNLNNEHIIEILETTPFTLLLLSGLETIGLGSIRELRGLPLYDYLEPYLSKQKGSILFEYSVQGVVQEYSIRIGVQTKTFKFNVAASEEVLSYVRNRIF